MCKLARNIKCYPQKKKSFISTITFIILGDPGTVSRVGRKGATKVFKYGRKSPWVPTLTELFPKIQVDAGPDWAQKMLCIIVPNRRTVSPKFLS